MVPRNHGIFPYYAVIVITVMGMIGVFLQNEQLAYQPYFEELTHWNSKASANLSPPTTKKTTTPHNVGQHMERTNSNANATTKRLGMTRDTTTVAKPDRKTNTNKEEDTRPWLIVHVGPPKTATTTIQDGFIRHAIMGRLAVEDNIYYLGMRFGERKDFLVGPNNATAVRTFTMTDIIKNQYAFTEKLREHQKAGHNVVLSSEHYTSKLNVENHWEEMFSGTFLSSLYRHTKFSDGNKSGAKRRKKKKAKKQDKTKELSKQDRKRRRLTEESRNGTAPTKSYHHVHPDYPYHYTDMVSDKPFDYSSEGIEPSFGFRVRIVVAYRHFFSWVPSLHYQRYLLAPKQYKNDKDMEMKHIPSLIEYILDYLDNAENNGNGKEIDIPNKEVESSAKVVTSGRKPDPETYHGLSGSYFAYLKWTSRPELYDRVDIFDMHQQPAFRTAAGTGNGNLFTDFVCQTLPEATHTCEYLIEDAADTNSTHNIVKRTRQGTKNLMTNQDKHRILEAARRRIPERVDPKQKIKRSVQNNIYRRIEDYFYQDNGIINNDRNDNDLLTNNALGPLTKEVPMVCLDEPNLAKLKKISLDYLREMSSLVKMHSLRRRKQAGKQTSSRRKKGDLFPSVDDRDALLLSRDYHEDDPDPDFSQVQAAHDAEFDKYVAKKKFCNLDLDKLLADGSFFDFVFPDFGNSTAASPASSIERENEDDDEEENTEEDGEETEDYDENDREGSNDDEASTNEDENENEGNEDTDGTTPSEQDASSASSTQQKLTHSVSSTSAIDISEADQTTPAVSSTAAIDKSEADETIEEVVDDDSKAKLEPQDPADDDDDGTKSKPKSTNDYDDDDNITKSKPESTNDDDDDDDSPATNNIQDDDE
ncbi:unnamed protein product [Pseudo-nitzschia multistriata]|uniref:Uncharacterized protein n=1 Tax=Pseudo-nitzschia multistriata TaxID=183589 RepID=A0A448ZF45_9STRA|nr:unnamed protein product [Pseudo-nitzschia multistriata]